VTNRTILLFQGSCHRRKQALIVEATFESPSIIPRW
jgi:hypothetical protein